jgi:hypothetical protein
MGAVISNPAATTDAHANESKERCNELQLEQNSERTAKNLPRPQTIFKILANNESHWV